MRGARARRLPGRGVLVAVDQTVETRPTLFALRALGLGDLLTAVPALRALAGRYPRHRLVLAAPGELRELLPLAAAVDELLPTAGLRPPAWRGPPPSVAVNLHGRGPQSIDALAALRPGRILSFTHPERPDLDGPEWWPDEHEVVRWCRLLRWYDIPADPDDLGLRTPRAANPVPGAVVVHPGAAYLARRWPADRYGAVIRRLVARGERVVVTGTAAERELAGRAAETGGLSDRHVLAGHTTLGQVAALVAGARLVVSSDTGVAHLATAYGRPSVTLFGPMSPQAWGPPPGRPEHTALWAGRTGDPRADRPDPGLLEITVTDVTDAALHALTLAPGRARPYRTRRAAG
ncbi:MAG: glycosyltransferase family 9 protein [Streptosporangiales bacterium]|nr:glycosyltransferase family 9 protein [Streptosporangiales bacterium]